MVKSKKKDKEMTRMTNDIKDAVRYYALTYSLGKYIFRFNQTMTRMPTSEILKWDDYKSWGQWRPGDLIDLPPKELARELVYYRGINWAKRAGKWIQSGLLPHIVLVDGRYGRCIGDGRSRVSIAVGLKKPYMSVILLTEDPHGKHRYTFYKGYPKRESLIP